MATSTIEDLRELLFQTARDVREGKIDVERARTIGTLGSVLVGSAMAEVRFLGVTGGAEGSGFIPCEPRKALPDASGGQPRLIGGRRV